MNDDIKVLVNNKVQELLINDESQFFKSVGGSVEKSFETKLENVLRQVEENRAKMTELETRLNK